LLPDFDVFGLCSFGDAAKNEFKRPQKPSPDYQDGAKY
jgi:hypothetical protein